MVDVDFYKIGQYVKHVSHYLPVPVSESLRRKVVWIKRWEICWANTPPPHSFPVNVECWISNKYNLFALYSLHGTQRYTSTYTMSLLSQYLSIIPQKLSWITISTMPHSILENHWLVSVCSVICQILKRLSASSWTLEFWFFSLGVIIITVMVSNATVGSNPWPVRWMWERNHLRELLTPPWEHRAPSPRATRSSNGKKLDTLGTSGTYLPMAKSKTQTLSAKHGRTSELPSSVFVLDKESPYPLSLNRPSGFWDTEIQISIQRSSSGLLTIHWESPIHQSNNK